MTIAGMYSSYAVTKRKPSNPVQVRLFFFFFFRLAFRNRVSCVHNSDSAQFKCMNFIYNISLLNNQLIKLIISMKFRFVARIEAS